MSRKTTSHMIFPEPVFCRVTLGTKQAAVPQLGKTNVNTLQLMFLSAHSTFLLTAKLTTRIICYSKQGGKNTSG